jgi:hypothetical protein
MKKLMFLLTAGILVTGCVESGFNPDELVDVTVDGKKFMIPTGAVASPHIATKKEIDFFKKSGVSSCKYGDITWEANSVRDEVATAIKNGDASIHTKLAQVGKIGCASAI